VQRAHQLRDARAIARGLRVLALASLNEGDEAQFQRLVQESADYARKAGDQWALLMALNNLGVLSFNAGDLDRAGQSFDEALRIACNRRDRRSEAFVLSNIGLLELERGHIDQARRELATSLRLRSSCVISKSPPATSCCWQRWRPRTTSLSWPHTSSAEQNA